MLIPGAVQQSIVPPEAARLDLDPTRFREQLLDLTRSARGLRDLEENSSLGGVASRLRPNVITSQSGRGLETEDIRSRLEGTEEVHTAPTSYTPFEPQIDGFSTTQPTIGGTYDGSSGDDTLTFIFLWRDAEVGVNNVNVGIFDGDFNRLENLFINRKHDPGTPIALANGLTLSLGAGIAKANERFEVDVSASVGSAVDPTKAFNGTGNDKPNFEEGLSVSAGSFEINGELITVLDSDSVNSILIKINAAAAGVIAEYNEEQDTVRLMSETYGENDIELTNDTSGFLAATKLEGATTTLGEKSDLNRALGEVEEFAGITSGSFFIGGQQFDVDITTDTVESLLDQINSADVGATAAYDAASDVFSLSVRSLEGIEVSAGSSNLLSVWDLAEGVYAASETEGKAGITKRERTVAKNALDDLTRGLNQLLSPIFDGFNATQVRSSLLDTLMDGFGASADATGPQRRLEFGLSLIRNEDGTAEIEVNRRRLEDALRKRPEELFEFLFGDEDGKDPGLVNRLDALFDSFGKRVDTYA